MAIDADGLGTMIAAKDAIRFPASHGNGALEGGCDVGETGPSRRARADRRHSHFEDKPMTAAARYRHIFTPVEIGRHRIRNRIVMDSMQTGLEDIPDGGARLAAYLVERARGGVGMIITGAISPHPTSGYGAGLWEWWDVAAHRHVTDAVHDADPSVRICMQILHAGPLADTSDCIAPSPIRSRTARHMPRPLDEAGIETQIAAFANCASLAEAAGYDGVEIVGSGGDLISSFLAEKTNRRTDLWGGDWERRMRFAVEIARRVRAAVGKNFILIFRISVMDMLQNGMTRDEIISLAKALEREGIDILNMHVGAHESPGPTIAATVPRAALAGVTGRLRSEVAIPVIASDRIDRPGVAEAVLARGDADFVAMARPMLADAELVNKARDGREDEINICIGCNPACLGRVYSDRPASCLVNARACRESELSLETARQPRKIAVVGAGPAGLAFATLAAQRGHNVTLFDKARHIGGQLSLARLVRGKEEFSETLRYFARMIEVNHVTLRLETPVDVDMLVSGDFDEIVIATGTVPGRLPLDASDHPKLVSHVDVIAGRACVGDRVAILAADDIGFDVAELVTRGDKSPVADVDVDILAAECRIDPDNHPRGGVTGIEPGSDAGSRHVTLLRPKGVDTGQLPRHSNGWMQRLLLQQRGVAMLHDVEWLGLGDEGLHIMYEGAPQLLAVDTIIACTGQEPARGLFDALSAAGKDPHLIGSACEATRPDARRAIRQASELAARL